MAINKYPYTDFNEYNLDWIILKIKEFESELTDYEALHSITFGGDWDISKSYTQWTIVSDPVTHDGYLSLQPVPLNVQITNTDYWLKIADYTTGLAALDARLDDVENEILKLDVYTTPEMFGAVGDGITDDTAALQDCFNNSDYVVMTKLYKVSSGLYLHSNLIIDGINQGKIIKDQNILTDYATLYYYGNSVINNVKIKNIELNGLKHWTGVSITGYANDYGIRIVNAENISVENCKFLEFGACSISIYGEKVNIDSNIIKYTGQFSGNIPNYNYGVNYDGEDFNISKNKISGVIIGILSQLTNKNNVISENDISTNGQHGLYMEGADHVIVISNTIHNCTLVGVKFQRDSQSLIFKDIIIANNTINNCVGQGVLLESLVANSPIENIIISGNVISHADRCIDITRVYNCAIQKNILYNDIINTERYLIYSLNSNNIKINANKMTAINGNAIWFNDQQSGTEGNNIAITNNDIKMAATAQAGTNYTGIRFRRGDNLYINGNTLLAESDQQFGTPYDGIFIENTETSINRFFILNNIIYGFRWDIRLSDNTNANIANCYYNNGLGV